MNALASVNGSFHADYMNRSTNVMASVATFLACAAVLATLILWPDTSDSYDADVNEVAVTAARAQAITAGGTLAVAASVLWVGSVLIGRRATIDD